MKHKAIVRIVIWSLVIVLLSSVLLFFLGQETHFIRDFIIASSPLGVEEAQPLESDDTIHYNKTYTEPIIATVLDELNLRSTPSPTAEAITMLTPGTVLNVIRTENVGGELWGYVSEPAPGGWIQMQYVEAEITLPQEDTTSGAPASTTPAVPEGIASVAASDVREISIDWAAGSITLLPTDGDSIRFYEEGGRADEPMSWNLRNGKLSISFMETQWSAINFSLGSRAKDLTVYLPQALILEELEIDAASADLSVQALTVQSLDLDTASGKVDLRSCSVGDMDVDTASGNISFTGTLNTLDCDAASADFEAVLTNVPRSIEMDSASGSLKLTLPENAGFSVNVDGLSSRFSSDFETTTQNGRFIHGDGACRIDMEAMSGKVTIKKAQ